MQEKITRLVAPLTLLEWGGILLYFYFSGRIHALLQPSFRLQVLFAGILLFFAGVVLLLTRNQKAVCGCGEEDCQPSLRSGLAGSIFFPVMLLVPFGVAAMTSRDAFSANAINMRGTVSSAAALPGMAAKFAAITQATPAPAAAVVSVPAVAPANPGTDVEPALPTADGSADPNVASSSTNQSAEDAAAAYFKPNARGNIEVNVADLLFAADEPTLRKPFLGKKAELIGQFMPATRDNPDGNRFKLVRMFMTCCAADAQPVSLLIEYPKGSALPKDVTEMTWTRVVGEVAFPTEGGHTLPILKASNIQSSAPPEETMLY